MKVGPWHTATGLLRFGTGSCASGETVRRIPTTDSFLLSQSAGNGEDLRSGDKEAEETL